MTKVYTIAISICILIAIYIGLNLPEGVESTRVTDKSSDKTLAQELVETYEKGTWYTQEDILPEDTKRVIIK